ncbi:hypothetical protein [Streptacidiphilus pinicola]|nr:hypothetical protein [Streptacidiphilus pinicola]
MDTNDPTQQTAAASAAATVAPSPAPRISDDTAVRPANPVPPAPTHERVLDLVALLVLIALAAAVFTLAGPGAFTAVTSVGMGLFATWRSHRPPRQ